MSQQTWEAVDRYFEGKLLGPDEALGAALAASAAAGLPPIQVTAAQGKALHILARSAGARSILEIGTLGGYSTIWLARALPAGGRLTTLEFDPRHAEVARANIAHAGLSDRVQVVVGDANRTLPVLAAEGRGPFDLIFIDADKAGYPGYFEWAVRLARRGSLIIADNVVRAGAVADPAGADESARGVRRMTDLVAAEGRVSATTLQVVGAKGHDGLMLILVTGDPIGV
ncbi:MAG TPA: O-methyltransferase [Opitutaceae bacterium]